MHEKHRDTGRKISLIGLLSVLYSALLLSIAEMYVQGVSTRRVKKKEVAGGLNVIDMKKKKKKKFDPS